MYSAYNDDSEINLQNKLFILKKVGMHSMFDYFVRKYTVGISFPTITLTRIQPPAEPQNVK